MTTPGTSVVQNPNVGKIETPDEEFARIKGRLSAATTFDIRECLPESLRASLSSDNLLYKLNTGDGVSTNLMQRAETFRTAYDSLLGTRYQDLTKYVNEYFDAAQARHLVWSGKASSERNDVKDWNSIAALRNENANNVGCKVMQDLLYNGILAIDNLEKIFNSLNRKDTLMSPQRILDQNLGAFIRELREDGGFKEGYCSLGSLQIVYRSVAEAMQLVYEPHRYGLVTSSLKGSAEEGKQPPRAEEDKLSKIAFKLLWDQSIVTLNHYQSEPGFAQQLPVINRILLATMRCVQEPDFNFTNLPDGGDACHICVWPNAVRSFVGIQNTVLTFLTSKIPHDKGFLSYMADDDVMVSSPLRNEDNGTRNNLWRYLHWKVRHTDLYPDGVIYEQARLSKITDIVRFELVAIFGKDLSKKTVEAEMAKDWKQMNPVFRELFFPEILLHKLIHVPSYFDSLNDIARPGITGKKWGVQDRQAAIDKIKIPLNSDGQAKKNDRDVLLGDLNNALLTLQFGKDRFITGPELAAYLCEEVKDKKETDSPFRGIFSKSSNHPALQEDMLIKAADVSAYTVGIPAFATTQKNAISVGDRESKRKTILGTIQEFGTLPFYREMDPQAVKRLEERVDHMFGKESDRVSIKTTNFGLALQYLLEQTRGKHFDLSAELQNIYENNRQDGLSHNTAKLMAGDVIEYEPEKVNSTSETGFNAEISGNLFDFNMSNFSFKHTPYPTELLKNVFNYIYRESLGDPQQFQIMRDVIEIFKNYDVTNTNQGAHSVLVALPYVLHRFNVARQGGDEDKLSQRVQSRVKSIEELVFEDNAHLFQPVKEALFAVQGLDADGVKAGGASTIGSVRVAKENNNNPFIEVYDVMRAREALRISSFIESPGDKKDFKEKLDNLITLGVVEVEKEPGKKVKEDKLGELKESRCLVAETRFEAKLFSTCFDSSVSIDQFLAIVTESPFNSLPFVNAIHAKPLGATKIAQLACDAGLFAKDSVNPKTVGELEKFIGGLTPENQQKLQAYLYHVVYSNMEDYNHFTYRRDQPALTGNPRIRSDDSRLHDEYYRLVVGARQIGYNNVVATNLTKWSEELTTRKSAYNPQPYRFTANGSGAVVFKEKSFPEPEVKQGSTTTEGDGADVVDPSTSKLPHKPLDPVIEHGVKLLLTKLLSGVLEDQA